jgi:hypothetical protein
VIGADAIVTDRPVALEFAILETGAGARGAAFSFSPFRCFAFFASGRFAFRSGAGLLDFGLRVVFAPEERAACLAEGLTIVAFWSLID